MDFLHLSHCNCYTSDLFLLLSHIVFCHWISQQQSPWLFILLLFCPCPILNQKTWLSEQGNLNIELYLKQRQCWCPCMITETCDCQITAACIMSSGKTERGNESCCSSDLQEDEVTSLQIWFPGFRSPCLKFLRPRGNSEHLPFRFPCYSLHHPQSICVSVTMVTLSTIYFLMLTQNSAPSTQGKCNLKYLKHTGVALRNLTSSASMTTPVDGPTP